MASMAERKDPPGSGDRLKQSLGAALDHDRKRRRGQRQDTAAPKRAKKRGKSLEQGNDRQMVNQLVTRDAQRHGDYRVTDFKLQEVTEGGRRVEKTIRVVRNVGASPIERWHSKHVFDERQMAAILFYQDAHRKVFGEGPRVTSNYSPDIIRGLSGSVSLWANSQIAAREALRLLDHEVFFNEQFDDFCVWQNVVIWGQPAGIAGAGAGFVLKKSAEARAKQIVCSIAHKVANIVIDTSRRDFGDLLLDLDAPRKARRKA